jgi:hypothetical protein
MKKIYYYIILFIALPYLGVSQSTETESALRNSQYFYGGSARFSAMGGAFTGLGGDITSLSMNPASVGVYSGLQMVFTPSLKYNKAKANVLGSVKENSGYNFNFHNIGLISSYKLLNDTRWKSFNFAIGYNQLQDFSNTVVGQNFNKERSLMDDFINNASNGLRWADYEELAWNSYLLNFDTTQSEYWTPITDAISKSDEAGIEQNKIVNKEGTLGEYFVSLGGNYAEKFYFGLGLGILRSNYTVTRTHEEIDTKNYVGWGVGTDFQSFSFLEYEKHKALGVNFKLGAIYKPIDQIKLGFAIHSPTFFDINYQWYNKMTVNVLDSTSMSTNELSSETDNYRFEYKLTTPFRFLAGGSFRIMNFAIISVDYEFIDYSMSRLKFEDGTSIVKDNDYMNMHYAKSHNFRVGSEFRYNQFYARFGYGFYDNPRNDKFENVYSSDITHYPTFRTNRQVYSTGIGYREKSFFIDAAYKYSFYQTNNNLIQPITVPINTKFDISKYLLTIGFRF